MKSAHTPGAPKGKYCEICGCTFGLKLGGHAYGEGSKGHCLAAEQCPQLTAPCPAIVPAGTCSTAQGKMCPLPQLQDMR